LILAHPECPPDVLAAADYAGSTAALADWVQTHSPAKVVLLTECSMSDNVAQASPTTEFVRPCNLCPHMKRITLASIYEALRDLQHVVEVPETVALRARTAIERMLALPQSSRPPGFVTGRAPVDVLALRLS
jgi:quinolinate synthase